MFKLLTTMASCGGPITSLMQNPPNPVIGQNVTLGISYNLNQTLTAGTALYSASINQVPVGSYSENLCDTVECPIEAGSHTEVTTFQLPQFTGQLTSRIEWTDQNDETVWCVTFKASSTEATFTEDEDSSSSGSGSGSSSSSSGSGSSSSSSGSGSGSSSGLVLSSSGSGSSSSGSGSSSSGSGSGSSSSSSSGSSSSGSSSSSSNSSSSSGSSSNSKALRGRLSIS